MGISKLFFKPRVPKKFATFQVDQTIFFFFNQSYTGHTEKDPLVIAVISVASVRPDTEKK
jgi:hypothetical protein